MQITKNCFVNNMPEDVYHNDPCQDPSLSSTMVIDLLATTEREVFETSKRLNPKYKKEKSSKSADLGNIAHDYVLKNGSGHGIFEVIPYDDFRTNDAKSMKAEIEGRGIICLNRSTCKIVDDVKAMRDRLYEQIDEHQEYAGILRKGQGEVSGFSHDGKIWNRIRLDWLEETKPDLIVDYKTTGLSFASWERNELWGESAKFLQWAHYRKVYKDITGRDATFVFVVQQTFAPYMVKIITIDKTYEEEIMMNYELARLKFANALKTGKWRGVPPYTTHSCPPPWVLTGWENAKMMQEFIEHQENKKSIPEPVVPKDNLMAG